jgi:hypothetical protein
MADLHIQEVDRGVIFTLKVVAGSSKTAVCGLIDDKLKIKVAAAREKGKANQCLLAFVARQLGVKKNEVSIISGRTSAIKQVQVAGMTADMLRKRLNLSEQG